MSGPGARRSGEGWGRVRSDYYPTWSDVLTHTCISFPRKVKSRWGCVNGKIITKVPLLRVSERGVVEVRVFTVSVWDFLFSLFFFVSLRPTQVKTVRVQKETAGLQNCRRTRPPSIRLGTLLELQPPLLKIKHDSWEGCRSFSITKVGVRRP